jgi:uncharacterized OB-fold protein
MSTEDTPILQLAHCSVCNTHTWPPSAYGCRRCGNPALSKVPLPQAPKLLNFVTVHSELSPGLPVPCVIGELELAPGVIEEALIGVSDEAGLTLGMAVQPQARVDGQGAVSWRFVPVTGAPS